MLEDRVKMNIQKIDSLSSLIPSFARSLQDNEASLRKTAASVTETDLRIEIDRKLLHFYVTSEFKKSIVMRF